MKIIKDIKKFVVQSSDSIQYSLEKINKNHQRLIYCISETGELEGVVTDGDFRRWVTKSHNVDLNIEVSNLMNRNFISIKSDSISVLKEILNEKIISVPILDEYNRISSIALKDDNTVNIEGFEISQNSESFLIAEIGNNHNGSFELAKKLIDEAYSAGANCVKFQLRDLNYLYGKEFLEDSHDLGTEYTLDLLKRYQLSDDDMFRSFDYARSKKLIPLCTPWDEISLEKLERYGLSAYKISSADLTNHPLIEAVLVTGRPIIISTGMSKESEIVKTFSILNQNLASYIPLHCNSTYPVPLSDINLKYMNRIKELSNTCVGYSGHERGFEVCLAAIAMGAKVIEKHFSLDRKMEGNDHKVSLLPNEFKLMVSQIRNIEQAMGVDNKKIISQGEKLNREVLSKSIFAKEHIKINEEIKAENLMIRSPGNGLQPSMLKNIIGKKAIREINAGDVFFESDLKGKNISARNYSFPLKFGIPVRYHDFSSLYRLSNIDFVEIHLSYRDLDLNPKNFLQKNKLGYIVHSPELFANDHIMDLASLDENYRNRSIDELKRVIDISLELKKYFISDKKTRIIINAGGATNSGFISIDKKKKMYETIANSLTKVDTSEVFILPQTMPPYPWHFGGQSFHNLFVNPLEIKEFCEVYKYNVCFDSSHSMLACNEYKWSISQFVRDIHEYISHIHLADAKGNKDEGLQIGEGNIDFKVLNELIKNLCPKSTFIPEIWQGHKNSGEGFWEALDLLENTFRNLNS